MTLASPICLRLALSFVIAFYSSAVAFAPNIECADVLEGDHEKDPEHHRLKTILENDQKSAREVQSALKTLEQLARACPTDDRVATFIENALKHDQGYRAEEVFELYGAFKVRQGESPQDFVTKFEAQIRRQSSNMPSNLEQSVSPKSRKHYREGLRLFRLERFDDANTEFELARAEGPTSSLIHKAFGWLNFKSGRYQASLDAYEKYLQTSPSARVQKLISPTLKLVKQKRHETYPTYRFISKSEPQEVTVIHFKGDSSTGTVWGKTPLTKKRLEPGRYTLSYIATGYEASSATLEVTAGADDRTETINLKKVYVTPPTDWNQIYALSSAGGGLLALGLGGYFMGQASDTADQAAAVSPATRFDGTYDRLQSDHQSQQTISVVSFGLGAALIVTGATLYVLSNGAKAEVASPSTSTPGAFSWRF